MNQQFLDDAIDNFLENSLRLERGIHGYFPFGRRKNLQSGRFAVNPHQRRYADGPTLMLDEALERLIDGMDEFDFLAEEWAEEDFDTGKRGQRKSNNLTRAQRQAIRNLAVQAAQGLGHRNRSGRSRRNIHDGGIARKANNIERRALRMIDSCNSYEQVIAWMRRNYGL
jgi:hypothetical protein